MPDIRTYYYHKPKTDKPCCLLEKLYEFILTLERLHLIWYLENIKKLNAPDIEKCLEIKERLQEYQADVLPLADPFYARAQKHRFATHKNIEGSSMHISNKLGYKLASLAVELHDIK